MQNLTRWLSSHTKLLFLAILFLYLFVGITHFQEETSTIGDNAEFLVLAKALADGEGYRAINFPSPTKHTKYPPAFPLILAVLYPFFKLNFMGYKIVIFLLSLFILLIIFLWPEEHLHRVYLATLLFTALNLKIHEYNSLILSEIPFLLSAMAGIYFFRMFEVKQKSYYFILSLISIILAFYIRSIGITLFLALILVLLKKRNTKYLLYTLCCAFLVIAAWQMWVSAAGGSSYLKQLWMSNPYSPELGLISVQDLFTRRLAGNLQLYFSCYFPEIILPIFKSAPQNLRLPYQILGLILSGLIVSGFILDFWKKWDVKGWYFLGTVGVILLWPEVWASERFLFGIIPLILYYPGYFIYHVSRKHANPD